MLEKKQIFALMTRSYSSEQSWILAPAGRLWRPPTDVYETGDRLVVRMEVAGMKEEDFLISFDGGVLAIAGQRRDHAQKVSFRAMEIPFGRFRVELAIANPEVIRAKGITAQYDSGFLHVNLPKRKKAR